MATLDDLARRTADLERRIEPLVWHLDLAAPNLRARLKAAAEKRRQEGTPPHVPVLDRGGLRDEAETLLRDLLSAFTAATPEMRAALRDLVRDHRHFAWAIGGAGDIVVPKDVPISIERCRDCLAWFAIQDQGRDPRDAILWLQQLCAAAERAGLPTASLLRDSAALASDEARFAAVGGVSTRALLLDYARRYG